jgi:hypothetical protein
VKHEEVIALLSSLATNRGAEGLLLGVICPFGIPALPSVFSASSTFRETQQFINPNNDFGVINISGRGDHQRLRLRPRQYFWSEVIAITIFKRISQAPAKRGWR